MAKNLKEVQKAYKVLTRAAGLRGVTQAGDLTVAARKIMAKPPRTANKPVTSKTLKAKTKRNVAIKGLI